MNTGQWLLSKSSLPSGSARSHLLAIRTDSGMGGTVFTSSVSVVTSEPQISVLLRKKKGVQQSAPVAVSRSTKHEPVEKQTFVCTAIDSAYAFGDGSFETFVTSSQNSVVAKISRRDVITRKNSKVVL